MIGKALAQEARTFFGTNFDLLVKKGYVPKITAEPRLHGRNPHPAARVTACDGSTLKGELRHPGGICIFEATKRDGSRAQESDLEGL